MQAKVSLTKSGFTVMELIIVILIIGILAAIVIPKFISTGNISSIMAADLAAAHIRAVRSAALNQGTWRKIQFSSGSPNYIVTGLNPNYPDSEMTETLPGNAVPDRDLTIVFNSVGEPQGFTDDKIIKFGEDNAEVKIYRITGTVKVTY